MIFKIRTDDELAGLDITAALDNAGIQHTIISKVAEVVPPNTQMQTEACEWECQCGFINDRNYPNRCGNCNTPR